MPEHLFVYGTLRPGRAPAEIASVVAQLTPAGPATVRALLYDLGTYPGIVLDPHADEVHGELLTLPDTSPADASALLARLDAYEGHLPAAPQAGLFRRVRTSAALPNGTQQTCWVYVYNQPLPAWANRSTTPL